MGIATRLRQYLNALDVDYQLVTHPYSEGSFNTARIANIPPHQLAKAVLFRDEDFNYTLAVLPTNHRVKRYTMNQIFDRHFELADEEEVISLFADCNDGAVPALGNAYELDVIWDDDLLQEPVIFIEAGDHEHLIKLRREDFEQLMGNAMHDHFSTAHRYRRPPQTRDGGYDFRWE